MRIKSTHPAFCTLRTSVNRINGLPENKGKPTTRISAGPEPALDDFGMVRDDQSSAIECKKFKFVVTEISSYDHVQVNRATAFRKHGTPDPIFSTMRA